MYWVGRRVSLRLMVKLLSIEVMSMRRIKTAFVVMDYSPAAMYILKIAPNVYDEVYAITLYHKRKDIPVKQIQYNPLVSEDFWEGIGKFIKSIAEEKGLTRDEYIVLLPFNVNQRNRFLEVNKKLSQMGIRNEAPSKSLTDEVMINFVVGRE